MSTENYSNPTYLPLHKGEESLYNLVLHGTSFTPNVMLLPADGSFITMQESFSSRVYHFLESRPHPQRTELSRILTAKTSLSTSGFPYISRGSFRMFLREIPHLFKEGNQLLVWLKEIESGLEISKEFHPKEQTSLKNAIHVLRNVVHSAAICAPPDLWILRHIMSNHAKTGLVALFQDGNFLDVDEIAQRYQMDARHLHWDLSFLYCRGYLRSRGSRFALAQNFQAADLYLHASALDPDFVTDMVEPLARVFSGVAESTERELVQRFYKYDSQHAPPKNWMADSFQMEVGYRLVPTTLALHSLNAWKQTVTSTNLLETQYHIPPEALQLLADAGMIHENRLTPLGLRTLQRAPGPFGIIHAYVPYMRELENKIHGRAAGAHVQRGKNIAASQTANRKTFAMANDTLDRFCKEQNFQYSVFIEHALGQGEATRQRLERNGENSIQYFGADLEDAAIRAAQNLQESGVLPKNMKFIARADIAQPDIVISLIRKSGFNTEGSVMFVGNGFHEVRSQTNDRIISVFRQYCDAGMLLIFTEESALGDTDLLNTGWNTYHAGFRYVHELSGQGLRPAAGVDHQGRFSWKICASLGGYALLTRYSVHTRTIYPFPRKGGYNPPISMTYFCVPHALAGQLGFYPVSWTQTNNKHSQSALLKEE